MKAWHAKAHLVYLSIPRNCTMWALVIPTFACAEAIAGLAGHIIILSFVELSTSGGHILIVA